MSASAEDDHGETNPSPATTASHRPYQEKRRGPADLANGKFGDDLVVRGVAFSRNYVDAAAFLVEQNLAVNQREQRPIAARSNIATGHKLRTALTDDDAASCHYFA